MKMRQMYVMYNKKNCFKTFFIFLSTHTHSFLKSEFKSWLVVIAVQTATFFYLHLLPDFYLI